MSDLDLLNNALADQHFGIAAYEAALGTGLLDQATADVARAFQSDQQVHRDVLTEQITSRGGTPVRPLDPEQYADSYPPLLTAAQVVAYAIKLEAAAARAGVTSVAEYEDRRLALLAAQIAGVEAQHWAILLNATGAKPVPAPLIEVGVPAAASM